MSQAHQGYFSFIIVIQKTKLAVMADISFRKPSLMPYMGLTTHLSLLPLFFIHASIVEHIMLSLILGYQPERIASFTFISNSCHM